MKKAITCITALFMVALGAQATLVYYGDGGYSNSASAGSRWGIDEVTWDATATGSDVAIGWAGDAGYGGVYSVNGTAGIFVNQGAGATLTDTVSGSGLVLTLDSATRSAAEATMSANNGSSLGVTGGTLSLQTDKDESYGFSWNQNVIVKGYNIWNWYAAPGSGSVSVDGVEFETWNSDKSRTANVHFTEFELAAGKVLAFTGAAASTGGFTLTGLVVETIPEPATLGLLVAASAGLLFFRRRLVI